MSKYTEDDKNLVAYFVSLGWTTREISNETGFPEGTVKYFRRRISGYPEDNLVDGYPDIRRLVDDLIATVEGLRQEIDGLKLKLEPSKQTSKPFSKIINKDLLEINS